jgi:hypothetical protein
MRNMLNNFSCRHIPYCMQNVLLFQSLLRTSYLSNESIKRTPKQVRDYPFKGTVSRDFRPSVFFSLNGTPGPPDSWAKAVLNIIIGGVIRFDSTCYAA